MISPEWLFSDPVPTRTKGWVPKAGRKVSIKQAFMSPEVGAGQDIVRDDWRLEQAPAPMAVASPQPQAEPAPVEDEAPRPAAPISRAGSAVPSPSGPGWSMEDTGIFQPVGRARATPP